MIYIGVYFWSVFWMLSLDGGVDVIDDGDVWCLLVYGFCDMVCEIWVVDND